MRVLVTGGAGFIGSHLVDKLIEKGYAVSVIDNLSTGKRENLNPKASLYELDIRDADGVANVFKKEAPEAVFHFAAQVNVRKSEENPHEDTTINALGGMNVVRGAIDAGVKKFIFASTGGALYGKTSILPTPEEHPVTPLSLYGHNKWFMERALEFHRRASDLDYASLRFSNVYGPRQNFEQEAGVIAIFINNLLSGKRSVIYGDGEQTRDFLFVDDAVEAALRSLEALPRPLRSSPVFNVGTGKETSVNTLFKSVSSAFDGGGEPDYQNAREEELRRSVLGSHKIKEQLGFEPMYDLDRGLRETIEWFQDSNR